MARGLQDQGRRSRAEHLSLPAAAVNAYELLHVSLYRSKLVYLQDMAAGQYNGAKGACRWQCCKRCLASDVHSRLLYRGVRCNGQGVQRLVKGQHVCSFYVVLTSNSVCS